ncbi:hypothetical protein [Luteolibacter sp. Populi]|uniref:hypothetical protein n=1 Tax=Luteolibacter sp. Populi TaxID=3230487 RepID=UPI00346695A2
MLKALLGLIVGLALGWGLGGSIFPSNARLIESWRKIQPGMSLQEVEAALGPPSYEKGVPQEARVRFPESYWKDHKLRTYIVKGLGPHLLFIAFDREGRVSFVSSSAT